MGALWSSGRVARGWHPPVDGSRCSRKGWEATTQLVCVDLCTLIKRKEPPTLGEGGGGGAAGENGKCAVLPTTMYEQVSKYTSLAEPSSQGRKGRRCAGCQERCAYYVACSTMLPGCQADGPTAVGQGVPEVDLLEAPSRPVPALLWQRGAAFCFVSRVGRQFASHSVAVYCTMYILCSIQS